MLITLKLSLIDICKEASCECQHCALVTIGELYLLNYSSAYYFLSSLHFYQ